MRIRILPLFVVAMVCLPSAARAQELRGTVRDSASRQPLPSVVLLLLDSSGTTLGRNITNERGEYRISLSPAIRRMRALRIGFRPRTVDVPRVESGFATLDLALAGLPKFLEAVRVIDQPNCPRRNDAAQAFALWEQARTALLATVVAREKYPADVIRLRFDRRLKGRDRVIEQTVRMDSASTSRPFVALRPAREFVSEGFRADTGGATLLAAPDADVMLDDAFATGYCFRIVNADARRPSEIGLGFAAAKHKFGRIDIEGAVWVDSTTRTLTRIEYRYVGLDSRLDILEPGGLIEFRPMPNGTVMIDRWFIRVVVADTSRGAAVTAMRGIALEAHEVGGEVADATWPTGQHWHGALGTLRGRLVNGGAAGGVVQLPGTPYRATTDSAGRFEISNLLPGPYSIVVIDPRLKEMGIQLKTGIELTAVRDSTISVLVEAPTAEQYLATLCEMRADDSTNSIFVLRVNLPDGSPAQKASVLIHQVRDENINHAYRGQTDVHGLVRVCRVPRYVTLEVRAESAGLLPSVGVRSVNDALATLVLQLKRVPQP